MNEKLHLNYILRIICIKSLIYLKRISRFFFKEIIKIPLVTILFVNFFPKSQILEQHFSNTSTSKEVPTRRFVLIEDFSTSTFHLDQRYNI